MNKDYTFHLRNKCDTFAISEHWLHSYERTL